MNITALRLRDLREKKGLSQNDVAKLIGVTRAAYNKYECGVSRPVRKLEELSALFKVSADYILGRDETSFENELKAIPSHEHSQIRKYLNLSEEGRLMVDIMLNAVCEREKRID
ncbi:MAG: helix-turn-helix transcriptional regulator [Selenomonadaceae bacterium]|nr:helix-turn-helix transcriptional regulator [Selenomonadaceae bacterium]